MRQTFLKSRWVAAVAWLVSTAVAWTLYGLFLSFTGSYTTLEAAPDGLILGLVVGAFQAAGQLPMVKYHLRPGIRAYSIATILGWTLGACLGSLLFELLSTTIPPGALMINLVIAGLASSTVLGTVLGLSQWLVLRHGAKAGRWRAIIMSGGSLISAAIGLIFALDFGLGLTYLLGWGAWVPALLGGSILAAVIGGLAMGLITTVAIVIEASSTRSAVRSPGHPDLSPESVKRGMALP